MSTRRFLARGLPAIVLAAVVAYATVLSPGSRHRETLRQPARPRGPSYGGYPRLANYNGLRNTWQIPFVAADDLVVARRGAPVRQLERANPHAVTLLYERTLQTDLCCVQDLYGLSPARVPPGWWLVLAGSRVSHPIETYRRGLRLLSRRGSRSLLSRN